MWCVHIKTIGFGSGVTNPSTTFYTNLEDTVMIPSQQVNIYGLKRCRNTGDNTCQKMCTGYHTNGKGQRCIFDNTFMETCDFTPEGFTNVKRKT